MKTLGFSSVLAHMNNMDHIYNPFIADLFVGNPNPHHIFFAHVGFVQQGTVFILTSSQIFTDFWLVV